MTLSSSTLTLKSLITKNVTIGNGVAPYTVVPEDRTKAAVKVYNDKNEFAVTGLHQGKTKITVTDKNGKTGVVEVTVE